MGRAILLAAAMATIALGCGQGDSASSSRFQLVSLAAAEVPTFLQVGMAYEISSGMARTTATVLEIDKKAGWIKVDYVPDPSNPNRRSQGWINLGQVFLIQKK